MKLLNKAPLVLLVLILSLSTTTANAAASMLPGSEQRIEPAWEDAWQKISNQKTRYLNRLVLSDSTYLRQHADNPIDWHAWLEAVFNRAEKENKLIFLSIGYASCHWCHVMEKESFADPEVATALNPDYISIKVDREQQPDIDAYYTLVVETIKGESGWPMTIVLTPDRKPIFAANYLDKAQLLTALKRLNRLWQEDPERLQDTARLFSTEIAQRNRQHPGTNTRPDIPWKIQAKNRLLASVDATYGGFGRANKFPDELKLQFLLNLYKLDQTAELQSVLIKQLNSIMDKGLSDVVFGGIFRYTTDREMTRPHFEKMLYNQALTVSLFADAANWLQQPVYRQFSESVIHFTDQSMHLSGGGYAAAIDADHGGREGAYYLWPKSALDDLPTGISKASLMDGHYYVYGSSADTSIIPWQSRMQQLRQSAPRIIDNQITAWNALWISALLKAGKTDKASKLANIIWVQAWDSGQLKRMGSQPGFLDDYAYLSNAFWDLYLQTGLSNWKSRARLLDQVILRSFYEDGRISYRSTDMSGQYDINISRDTELPATLSAVLHAFKNHQTEAEFIEAYINLQTSSYATIGGRPEYYLGLIQQDIIFPETQKILAKGHGIMSLHAGTEPGEWLLELSLDADWHINAAEVFDKNLIPLKIESDDGILNISYPPGSSMVAKFSTSPLNIYSNNVSISINTPATVRQVQLQVQLQACSSRLCLLPEKLLLTAFNKTAD